MQNVSWLRIVAIQLCGLAVFSAVCFVISVWSSSPPEITSRNVLSGWIGGLIVLLPSWLFWWWQGLHQSSNPTRVVLRQLIAEMMKLGVIIALLFMCFTRYQKMLAMLPFFSIFVATLLTQWIPFIWHESNRARPPK